ncbi:MAG: methylated-DNA--[protein]-cysteine S-methyltransferase [Pseudohongiellaceae bacterium]
MTTFYDYLETPIGSLLLAGNEQALTLVGFPRGKERKRHETGWIKDATKFKEVKKQLQAYFAGELTEFDLNLAPVGTDFQRKVWKALQKIPYGETVSYGDIALRIGKPKASRAVGAANGKNPIPIIIPCHRVIGSTGKLTGFGGGLPTKEKLLNLEQQRANPGFRF